jgi:two-component sensor histidine kinase
MEEAGDPSVYTERLRFRDLQGRVHHTVGSLGRSEANGEFSLALLDISAQVETERRLQQHANHLQTLHASATELNASIQAPKTLYRRSLELLRNTVHFDSASVQVLDGDELRIVAALGFAESERVTGMTFPFDRKFPNWHVVTSRQIIAVADVGDDYPHFVDQAETFASGNIRSWLGVPLTVGDDVIGMIALDRNQPISFSPDEQRLVATMAGHIAVAMHNADLYQAQQRTEQRLVEANRQKELLLRELHHRVKNNMQLVSSLLSLRTSALSSQEDGRIFDEVRMRIHSLSAIHEELYRSDTLDSVDLGDYARKVVEMVCDSYRRDAASVMNGFCATVDAESVGASMDVSVPFGLILSELVLNALKHAFPDREPGTIAVRLHRHGADGELIVEDDGVGLTEEKRRAAHDSLGMQLITSLADQIRGSICLEECAGTRWVLRFPLPEPVSAVGESP